MGADIFESSIIHFLNIFQYKLSKIKCNTEYITTLNLLNRELGVHRYQIFINSIQY